MIVPMYKIFIAARIEDREGLLASLGRAGVVHIQPADPAAVLVDAATRHECQVAERAATALHAYQAQGDVPDLEPMVAAQRVDHLLNRIEEAAEEVRALSQRLRDFGPWGEVRLADLEALDATGVRVALIHQAGEETPQATVLAEVGYLGGKPVLAAINPPAELPAGCTEIPRPERDAEALRQRIHSLEEGQAADRTELASLARLRDDIHRTVERIRDACALEAARRSGLAESSLFALQGWVPERDLPGVSRALDDAGIAACLSMRAATEDEQPPTHIEYPAWVKPIKGLFDILGTVAGYREFDVSVPFILALPFFAAILISDAGYGLLLMVIALVLRKRIAAGMGTPTANLAMILGGATVIWGLLTASVFGFQIYPPVIEVGMDPESRRFMSSLSLWIAGIHLSVAWAWQALRLLPNQRFLACVGWVAILWGVLGLVFSLLLKTPFDWSTPWPWFLVAGIPLAVLFHSDSRNPFKRIGLGIANLPLEILGKFSDEISYIRLMAVGLASTVLAQSFNEMAAGQPLPLMVLIFLGGHLLNFALCLIAVFAHGVRLNMLEFSNNLGMEWKGYSYNPFSSLPTTAEAGSS